MTFFIGLVVISLTVGNNISFVGGWLIFGGGLIFMSLLSTFLKKELD